MQWHPIYIGWTCVVRQISLGNQEEKNFTKSLFEIFLQEK